MALLAGCVRPTLPPPAPVFYPPLPDQPRIQFLRHLTSAQDVRPRPSAFERFILGEASEREAEGLNRPYGLAFWQGKLYVCDSGAHQMAVFDLARRQYRSFGKAGAYRIGQPINVTIRPEGEKYIADALLGQVLVLDREDRPIRSLTRPEAMKPCDAVWRAGELFVADVKSHSILVFDPVSGRLLRQFGKGGSQPGEFYFPTNLAFGPDGSLYVSDELNARVQQVDRNGAVLRVIGTRGRAVGQMVRPRGVAVDRDGRLYVCDAAAESVQIYDAEGRLLMVLGGPGTGRGDLVLPARVSLSYDGIEYFARDAAPGFRIEYLIFVTSQLGPNKVNVYGFGAYAPPAPGS